jgi:hypothetical protein
MPPEDPAPGRELAWPDDELVVRYLLGALPDDDTECLDELSITDDEFALRLRTVEQDLVDAHVKGELSAAVGGVVSVPLSGVAGATEEGQICRGARARHSVSFPMIFTGPSCRTRRSAACW